MFYFQSCLPLQHHEVIMPTLLLWGERDAFMEVEMAEITRIYVKNHFRLTILSEASHWLQQDQPDIVNKLIWTFLKEETKRKREWLFVHVLRGLNKSSSDLKPNCDQGHISSLPSILSSVREKCFHCTVHLDTNRTAKRSEYENIWYQHWFYLYTCILHIKTPALKYICICTERKSYKVAWFCFLPCFTVLMCGAFYKFIMKQ